MTSVPELIQEDVWLAALDAAGRRGGADPRPVPLDLLEEALVGLDPVALLVLAGRQVSTERIVEQVRALRDQGATEIAAPLPQPDQIENPTGGAIWDLYSPERLRQRTEAVYAAAIRAYEGLVSEWFAPFRPRLRTAATLPAVLRGTLNVSPPAESGTPSVWRQATIIWRFDPLPRPGESRAEIVLGSADQEQPSDWDDWREQGKTRYTKLLELRPEASEWITSSEHHSVLDVFGPAPVGGLAYKWLANDLGAINWA